MVHVSTDTGEGATGLQTWERAHTEEGAHTRAARVTLSTKRCPLHPRFGSLVAGDGNGSGDLPQTTGRQTRV